MREQKVVFIFLALIILISLIIIIILLRYYSIGLQLSPPAIFSFSNSLYSVSINPRGEINISTNGENYTFHSLLSTPSYRPYKTGGWAYNNNFNSFGSYNKSSDWTVSINQLSSNEVELIGKTLSDKYSWKRKFTFLDNRVLIHDTISNQDNIYAGFSLSNRFWNTGIIENEIRLGGKKKDTPPGSELHRTVAENPSTFLPQQSSSVLIITRDENLRTFLKSFSDFNHLHESSLLSHSGLAATVPRLGFKPLETREFDWEIHISNNNDYFDLVNKLRQEWGLNRQLDGQFAGTTQYVFSLPSYKPPECCLPSDPTNCATKYFEDNKFDDFREMIRYMGVKYLLLDTGRNTFQIFEDNAFPNPIICRDCEGGCSTYAGQFNCSVTRLKEANPDLNALVYFNPGAYFNPPADDHRFDNDKIIRKDGSQRNKSIYGWYFFYSTQNNNWGTTLYNSVNNAFNKFDIDGLYIDEMTSYDAADSYLTYDSVDFSKSGPELAMDLADETLLRHVSRLSLDFRESVINNVLGKNKVVINNFFPVSERINSKPIFSFVETGTRPMGTQSPIVYGTKGKGHFISSPIGLAMGGFGGSECYLRMNRTFLMESVRRNLGDGLLTYYYHFSFDLSDKTPLPTTFMFPITITKIGEGFVQGERKLFTIKGGTFSLSKATNGKILYFDSSGHLIPSKIQGFSGNTISIGNVGEKEIVLVIDNSVLDYDLDGINADIDCDDFNDSVKVCSVPPRGDGGSSGGGGGPSIIITQNQSSPGGSGSSGSGGGSTSITIIQNQTQPSQCIDNESCLDYQYCENNLCTNIICEGDIINHSCIAKKEFLIGWFQKWKLIIYASLIIISAGIIVLIIIIVRIYLKKYKFSRRRQLIQNRELTKTAFDKDYDYPILKRRL